MTILLLSLPFFFSSSFFLSPCSVLGFFSSPLEPSWLAPRRLRRAPSSGASWTSSARLVVVRPVEALAGAAVEATTTAAKAMR